MNHTIEYVIQPNEVELSTVRAQGAGGRTSTRYPARFHLRFDIQASSLPGNDQDAPPRVTRQSHYARRGDHHQVAGTPHAGYESCGGARTARRDDPARQRDAPHVCGDETYPGFAVAKSGWESAVW